MKKKLLLLIFLLIGSTTLLAQGSTIENQFNDVIKKSNSYKEFKVIEKEKINTLKVNVLDSIATYKINIEGKAQEIEQQNSTISQLKNDLANTQNTLNDSKEMENSIKILGFIIKKSTYTITVFTILIIFLLIVFSMIYNFRKSYIVTKSSKEKLIETEEEYEGFRQRSLEREQKLRRKLQDEINKNKEA